MSKNTTNMLFLIISAALQSAPLPQEVTSLSKDELQDLLLLAESHDLSHIVANALLEGALFADLHPRFQRIVFKALFRYEGQQFELNRICDLLTANEIPHIPLKGSILRKYYPQPWMRTSCDIDILVKKADLERARNAIIGNLDYEYRDNSTHDITLFSKNGVCLELHFDLQESDFRELPVLENIWDGEHLIKSSPFTFEMSNELFLLYHIYHMAKHFVHGGCGIRPFIDLWLLCKKIEYRKDLLNTLLSDAGLLTFASSASNLCGVWFSEEQHNDLTREMADYILHAGVYGSTENRVAIEQTRQGGKAKYLFYRIFPPYSYMSNHYPRLKKAPILLPWFYLVRWFRFLFKKEKSNALAEFRLNSSLSEDKATRLHTMCDTLSLL